MFTLTLGAEIFNYKNSPDHRMIGADAVMSGCYDESARDLTIGQLFNADRADEITRPTQRDAQLRGMPLGRARTAQPLSEFVLERPILAGTGVLEAFPKHQIDRRFASSSS